MELKLRDFWWIRTWTSKRAQNNGPTSQTREYRQKMYIYIYIYRFFFLLAILAVQVVSSSHAHPWRVLALRARDSAPRAAIGCLAATAVAGCTRKRLGRKPPSWPQLRSQSTVGNNVFAPYGGFHKLGALFW